MHVICNRCSTNISSTEGGEGDGIPGGAKVEREDEKEDKMWIKNWSPQFQTYFENSFALGVCKLYNVYDPR